MNALIGYTGFVGSNLASSSIQFDALYNSKNIQDAFDTHFDLVIYAGVRAEKYLANQNPDQDMEVIMNAIRDIQHLNTKRFVLISTIDVYNNPQDVDENSFIDEQNLHPYGSNRRFLEKWVQENVENSLIVRLPALYGINLKKNFVFDIMNISPSMIKVDKFEQLKQEGSSLDLDAYYGRQDNGFYKIRDLSALERSILKDFFYNNDFNAMSFTDSRNEYPFYPLKYLWNHINLALENNIKLVCLNSEPVSASEVYQYIFGKPFSNITAIKPTKYNIKSIHAKLLGGRDGYIFDKRFILDDIRRFVKEDS